MRTADRPTLRGGNFPLSFTLWLLLIAVGLLGASKGMAGAFTRQTARLVRFQCDASYSPAGTLIGVRADAYFKTRYVNDTDPNDAEEAPNAQHVAFDLLATPGNTTTVAIGGGVTVTDAQLAALIRKRSEQAAGL